ncbi:threonine/serine exporter family protein [Paramicrobacterium fandaimingii]|uniref:threonine/serine exporter family protein n=1 Tax=Paramicrobacterium fandaimingii TaxID=2708079 RepID=UPI00141E1D74|nr:threonine/serine exporter family protein [Microbacterium fandaimingii]
MSSPSERLAVGQLGALLLDAGVSVTDTRTMLVDSIPQTLRDELSIAVLPANVFIGETATANASIVESPKEDLSLLQAARTHRLMQRLAAGTNTLQEAAAQIASIRAERPRHPDLRWVLGNALISAGLATLFRCPWWAIVLALVVGILVGGVMTWVRRLPGSVAILPFLAAFVSTLLVGGAAQALALGDVPLFAICAPVALLVPGALITNSLLELTSVDTVTGTSRLIYGTIMLGFMAAGIAAGVAITGVQINAASASRIGETLSLSTAATGWQGFPPTWFAWLGVVVLAIGVGVAFGADHVLIMVTIVMMVVTYGMLVGLGVLVGDVAAAGITACILFIAARLLERTTRIAPAVAFFQPAFLLLVPGTVGLVALTSLEGDALVAALGTFVSLCIGTKLGAIVFDVGRSRRRGRDTLSPTAS